MKKNVAKGPWALRTNARSASLAGSNGDHGGVSVCWLSVAQTGSGWIGPRYTD